MRALLRKLMARFRPQPEFLSSRLLAIGMSNVNTREKIRPWTGLKR